MKDPAQTAETSRDAARETPGRSKDDVAPGARAFLFPGQGSQFVGMGRDLFATCPRAAEVLRTASTMSGFPLAELCLRGPSDLLARTDVLQPAVTAVTLGCLEALREAGVEPDVVAGHSLGEFAALHAAGVLSLEDTLALVCERGRLMHAAAERVKGVMTAVEGLEPAAAMAAIAAGRGRGVVAIANFNSPKQFVLSGEDAAVAVAEGLLAQWGARLTRLRVSGAWHSALLSEAAERFGERLRGVTFRSPRTILFLNATGDRVTSAEAAKAAVESQMTSSVHWHRIIEGMIALGTRDFVEVGPGKVLRGLLRQTWRDYGAYSVRGVEGPSSLKQLQQQSRAVAA